MIVNVAATKLAVPAARSFRIEKGMLKASPFSAALLFLNAGFALYLKS
jgi:hypothetical protein